MVMTFTPTRLTLLDAAPAVRAGCDAIAHGVDTVDLGQLQRFDSAALAALLEWQRAAAAHGKQLRVLNLPPGLASIARVYGLAHRFVS